MNHPSPWIRSQEGLIAPPDFCPPPFSEIQDHMNYHGNTIYKASFEYSRILEDIQNQQESFLTLFETLYTSILENPINEDEALLNYTDRIVSLNGDSTTSSIFIGSNATEEIQITIVTKELTEDMLPSSSLNVPITFTLNLAEKTN